jgi:beta-mannosidase
MTSAPPSIPLDGLWRAAPADEDLRRVYPDAGFDDESWEQLAVPGHWSSSPAFAGFAGPVLHRRRFDTPSPFGPGAGDPGREADGRRTWLVLDGVFYTSDLWLDGTYVGDTEGYFAPHAFEVTDALAARREHTLAIEVACRADTGAQRTVLGSFGAFSSRAGGLWRPVRLEQSGPVRIARLRVICTDVTDETATVAVQAVLDSTSSITVAVGTSVTSGDGAGTFVEARRSWPLAGGENQVAWTVTVPRPRRWWPRALGDQPLYDVNVEVFTPADRISDARQRRLGLRTVTADDWIFRINGERLFLKGAAQGPERAAPAEATAAEAADDVRLALDAGLDLLRLRAHVARPELYEAADREGLLLWQDLPLQGRCHRGVRRQAREQAGELVDLLGHHPSVVQWCAHDEPEPLDAARQRSRMWGTGNRLVARTLAAHLLPSWSRTVLDRSVRAVFTAADGSRPVVAHAGVLPHPPSFSGTDSHLSFGWYHHEERDLEAALRLWPRLARFVGSFGAPSVPTDAEGLTPERWPVFDGALAAAVGDEREVFERVLPPAAHPSFAEWQRATQLHQARLVRHHIETLRRLKYRPCGGFALAEFADGAPGVTPAVLDHRRRPKLAYAALVAACSPVAVVADRPPGTVRPGQSLAVDIHVINDRHIALDDMMLSAYLRWGESSLSNLPLQEDSTTTAHRWRWHGDVPPDDCIRIGTVQAVAPDQAGPLVLDVQLAPRRDPHGVVAANRYTTDVVPAPGPANVHPT